MITNKVFIVVIFYLIKFSTIF